MKKAIIISVAVVLVIYISFFTPVSFFFGRTLINVYKYESTEHGFKDSEVPEKGRTLESIEGYFQKYKEKNLKSDVELRRTFKKNFLKIWK